MSQRPPVPTDRPSWEKRYVEGNTPWDRDEPDEHLLRVVEQYGVAAGRSLDVGCGTGTNPIWMAQRGFQVTGLDISSTAIETAQTKAAAAGVTCQLIAADFLADAVPGAPFEFVHDRGVFHLFDDPEKRRRFAARVAEVLAPEGLWHSLLGSTDGPPREAGPPRRTAAETVTAVEPWFEILELRTATFDQGKHEDARAWVLVARRRAD